MHRKMLLHLGALLLVVYGADAVARHGHRHGRIHSSVGFYFNDPFWWGPDPFFYPYRPYVYNPPPVIIEQREPPVYIQRQMAPAAPAPAAPASAVNSNWYYCPKPAGYYPYIQSCSQPWVSVDPRSVQPAPTR